MKKYKKGEKGWKKWKKMQRTDKHRKNQNNKKKSKIIIDDIDYSKFILSDQNIQKLIFLQYFNFLDEISMNC